MTSGVGFFSGGCHFSDGVAFFTFRKAFGVQCQGAGSLVYQHEWLLDILLALGVA